MTGILIVFYNQSDFLLKQYDHLKAFCKEPYELIVIDNSTEPEAIENIRYHSQRLGLRYIKTNATSSGGSDSHAFAISLAYQKFRNRFKIIVCLDHDCIPVKPFSPSEILANHLLAGLGQERPGVTYFWPGLFMFKTSVPIDFGMEKGSDTGGNTYKAINAAGMENCIFFDEQYCQNPGFTIPPYNFYALLNNGTFLHFINGSNWAKSEENTDRLNSLFNVLAGHVKAYMDNKMFYENK